MNLPLSKLSVAVTICFVTSSFALVLGQGALNPVTRPRVTPQIQINKVSSQYSYAKKRLTISTVDFLSSAPNPSYTNTGEAVLTFTADDVVDLPPDLKPELTIFATSYPVAFKQVPQSPERQINNIELYEFNTGTAQQVEGSRVYATYNKEMQTIRLKLMQTYYQIDARSTSGNRGISSDVFCIHVNLVDHQRKSWFFGKGVVRLFTSGREEAKAGG